MDKRFQVFVSSTYEDLKEERNRVIQALLNINCIPCGMEYFPAANEDAWECIERLIPECDYYVILLAGKYGSSPKGKAKSYTHLEYELAVKHKVPILGLLHRSPSKLPFEKSETTTVRQKQLEAFRSQVSRKLCRFWDAADQLPGELIASLSNEIRRTPRIGWVRGDSIADDEAKTEIIKLQRKIELQNKLVGDLKSREENQESSLASGDEPFYLTGVGSGTDINYEKENDAELYTQTDVSVTFELHTTWNSILRFIREQLSGKWTTSKLAESMLEHVTRCSRELEPSEGQRKLPSLNFKFNKRQNEDLIQVQLTALGLATRKDNSWELTAKGLTQASRMLAIKKGDTTRDQTEWCLIKWGMPQLSTDQSRFFL